MRTLVRLLTIGGLLLGLSNCARVGFDHYEDVRDDTGLTGPFNGVLGWSTPSPTSETHLVATWSAEQPMSVIVTLYRGPDCSGEPLEWSEVSSGTSAYVFEVLEDGVYSYSVRSRDGSDAVCSDAIVVDTTPPPVVTDLCWSVGAPTTNTTFLTAQWTRPADYDASRHEILLFDDSTCTSPAASPQAVALADNSFSFVGVDGLTYRYRIRSFDAVNNAGLSACSVPLTVNLQAPAAATGLGWVESSPYGGLAVNARWTASPSGDVVRQEVFFYSTGSCTSPAGSTPVAVAAETTSFTGTSGQTYSFEVEVENAGGFTARSACSPAMTLDTDPPAAATGLGWVEASPVNATTVNASWTVSASPDAVTQSIEFFRSNDCTATITSSDLGSPATNTAPIASSDGEMYTYRITTTDAAGNSTVSPCSAAIFVTRCAGTSTSYNDSGSGTLQDPYVLCQAAQLVDLSSNPAAWNRHFVLGTDLDMVAYDEGSYTPIGSASTPFSGTFDGMGHVVENFTYDDAARPQTGLFGVVSGVHAEIRRLGVTGADVIGEAETGILAGTLQWGTVSECWTDGQVVGKEHTGGLVGRVTDYGWVSTSYSAANVGDTSSWARGGLVGTMNDSFLYRSYATGPVNSQTYTGGLVGYGDSGMIHECYASGTVNGQGVAGGLVSRSWRLVINNSFAVGDVTGDSDGEVGRIVGEVGAPTVITNTYYWSGSSCTNSAGSCNDPVTGTTGVSPLTYFYDQANPPLDQWKFGSAWTTAGSLPITAVDRGDPDLWGTCADHLADAPFAGGTGTVEYPYLICSAAQFAAIGADPSLWQYQAFRLMDHIDLTGYSEANLSIIGSPATPFVGRFDGGGHNLANLRYHDSGQDYVGLIGVANLAWVVRMALDVDLEGRANVAGVVASATGGVLLSDTHVGGNLVGTNRVASIVGECSDFNAIRNVYGTAAIAGDYELGGVVAAPTCVSENTFYAGDLTANAGAWDAGPVHGLDWNSPINGYYSGTCTNCTNSNGTGVAEATLYDAANPPLNSWRFFDIWQENGGDFPSLREAP